MIKIRFVYKYIIEFIKRNPVRIFMIFIIFVAYPIAINKPDNSYNYKILDSFKSNGIYIYVTKLNDNIKILHYNVPLKEIVGETHIKHKTSTISVLIFVLVGFFTLFIIISAVDNEGSWEFKDIYWHCCFMDINVFKDVDVVYYVYDNKVIHISKMKPNVLYEIRNFSKTRFISDIKSMKENPNLFETYKGTRCEIRDKKIKDIIS